MEKHLWSESDICDKRITPAIVRAGWNAMDQMLREYTLRPGRVVVRGQASHRDKASMLRADYVLFHKPNVPLAVVEAKDAKHSVGAGMPQAIQYAELLGVPFSFASNKMNQEALVTSAVPLPAFAEQPRIGTCVIALHRLCTDPRHRLAKGQAVQPGLAEMLAEEVA